jgi:hypothetical protein
VCSAYDEHCRSSGRPAKRQQTLSLGVHSISKEKKDKLDSAAALAVYMSARPFRLWEDKYFRQLISLLSDNLYIPPHRDDIGGVLLDQTYLKVRHQVLDILDHESSLQFVLDESTDINHRRMVNLSVVIPKYGSFYLENEFVHDNSLNAQWFVEWFLKKTKQYCSDLKRMSSLSTDTCKTMRNSWAGLEEHPLLAHAFFIPCDSHGLQLLIKDILKSHPFCDIISKAQTIVAAFHRAPKQYAILRSKQVKQVAFVLSVITRWGTQYGLVLSVLKNKEALFLWIADSRARVGKKKNITQLRSIIVDSEFWSKLGEVAEIIKPIHEAQKMSESNSATLAHVIPRWLRLESKLVALSELYPYLKPILAPGGIFNTRLNMQTSEIHWAAFVLDPTSHLRFIDGAGKQLAIDWLLDHADPAEKKEVSCSIQDFLAKKNDFTRSHHSQLHIDDPLRYWNSYLHHKSHKQLAQLAVRIFETIANSVSSERAFSAMGLIVTKLRNRLGPEKADKLIFIYMNQRVLDKHGDILLGDWVDKSDNDQVDLEELLLALDKEDDQDDDQDNDQDDDIELDIEREDDQIAAE